ncbi:cytokinesis protein 3 [Haplosporangium sp. Z 27]|nr:cytokinesis protein 3 [Haplosporangium sp. Z 27]
MVLLKAQYLHRSPEVIRGRAQGKAPLIAQRVSPVSEEPQLPSPVEISNAAVYSPGYTTSLLSPSELSASLSPVQSINGKHFSNRYSIPSLVGDDLKQQQQQLSYNEKMTTSVNYIQHPTGSTCAPETRSASYLPQGQHSGEDIGKYGSNLPSKQELLCDHNNYSEDPQHFQPGTIPRTSRDYYSRQFGVGGNDPGRGQSTTTVTALPLHQYPHQREFNSIDHSDLSSENMSYHDRSQSILDPPKLPGAHCSSHERSVSRAILRADKAQAFNSYDIQQQRSQRQQHNAHSTPVARKITDPSIIIPKLGGRRQSALAAFGSTQISPTESSLTSTFTSVSVQQKKFSGSPTTPDTATLRGIATPTSASTSMSDASAFSFLDNRRKSETVRLPPIASMTNSNFIARKFSVDANRLLASSSIATATSGSDASDDTESLEIFGTYTARKPKATLIRAFKQIINPKKVAEKDAIRNKNDHFAWIDMQKSLKRVSSPDIGKELSFFTPSTELNIEEQDPFEALKKCQVMRDTSPGPGTTNDVLDFGPNAFVQVDKVARNVNQRGQHITPQLLSQKYLTRPYSKSLLSKLRVLFVWVSENIKLEGGPARDVSGGRYKLGPAGEHMTALTALTNDGAIADGESPSPRSAATTPLPAIFMTGIEEYARGFLQEDTPELAQDVLTTRTCKTGEGFANLFAEMALAAGIEDVGVVKGYTKGPMDVFSKDIPPPNHAWNVVRIGGTYRFIDCCLASPSHPAHYPNRPQVASSFYFLTSPTDLALSHSPVFLTYQYITPSISPQIFLQLPFIRPAYFDFGLSLPNFRKLTRLDIKGDEPIEVVVRIDGGGGSSSSSLREGLTSGQGPAALGTIGAGHQAGVYGGECLGKGCGERIELRAEVEVMTNEGKIIRKRALAQVMIWNPYQHHTLVSQQGQYHLSYQGTASSTLSVTSSANTAASATTTSNRLYLSHHCTGIRIAKIKAVLPAETVVGTGGVRKGVVHIYAGRKVENSPSDATPYPLALSLPIHHMGSMPKTPLNFVLPHFSPYEFYIKAPQTELLYYPHTYKFSILSLAAQAQATLASANAITVAENEAVSGTVANNSISIGSINSTMTSPRRLRTMGGGSFASTGPSSPNPLFKPHQQNAHTLRGFSGAGAQTLSQTDSPLSQRPRFPISSRTASISTVRGGLDGFKGYPCQHHHLQVNSSVPMASTSSSSVTSDVMGNDTASIGTGVAVPRPERLVLRTQTNRIYKLVYDPVRQCHEAQVDVKERGVWECVRMDDGGKSRVGREGTGGVVIASWKCV